MCGLVVFRIIVVYIGYIHSKVRLNIRNIPQRKLQINILAFFWEEIPANCQHF